MKEETIQISDIQIGDRVRKDLGDIDNLAESIQSLGLLQPPVVNSEYKLIAGYRRIKACEKLGREKIQVRVAEQFDDILFALQAEQDENTCRKDFTPEEIVVMAEEIEKQEKKEAKERQGRAKKKRTEKNSKAKGGRSRDKVSKALGVSDQTLRKARAVVNSGDRETIDEMNKTRKVNKAYKKIKGKNKNDTLYDKWSKACSKIDIALFDIKKPEETWDSVWKELSQDHQKHFKTILCIIVAKVLGLASAASISKSEVDKAEEDLKPKTVKGNK